MEITSGIPPIEAPRRLNAVSVVIVVWNAKRYVLECLESLRKHCEGVYDEVIIVDNASTDGTPEAVAEFFPEFRQIRNAANYGFAKANNIGIEQCSGDFVCLVNSDVVFINDCISPMLQYLRSNTDVAVVGPRMLGPDRRVRRSTMRFPTVWNNFCRALGLDLIFRGSKIFGGFLMADFHHDQTMQVEVLNGWFLVVRRDAMEQVGLLDTQFFMYGEDLDWSYRFHRAGYPIVFFSGAEAIHYGGSSSANAPVRFNVEMTRANSQYWRKHHGWVAQRIFLLSLILHHSIRALGFAVRYFLVPGQRAKILSGIRRSVSCLRWTALATQGKEDLYQMGPR